MNFIPILPDAVSSALSSAALFAGVACLTVFSIQAKTESPCVGASELAYEIVGPTNDVRRTVHVPFTAWDIWDTGLSFNVATNKHFDDAINLRHVYATNAAIDYAQGEWTKPRDHAAAPTRNEPACWIAGTTPVFGARFEVRPPGIARATLSAAAGGTILGGVGGSTVAFSNDVTLAGASYTEHADHARLWMDSAIPAVVSRSTNEVWTWSVSRIDGHALPLPVVVATNGPSVAYSTSPLQLRRHCGPRRCWLRHSCRKAPLRTPRRRRTLLQGNRGPFGRRSGGLPVRELDYFLARVVVEERCVWIKYSVDEVAIRLAVDGLFEGFSARFREARRYVFHAASTVIGEGSERGIGERP